MRLTIPEVREEQNMLDQLRLESYGCCCRMKVYTAVALLGWVGIITSVLAVIAGITVAVLSTLYSHQHHQHRSHPRSYHTHLFPHPPRHEHLPHQVEQGRQLQRS